MPARIQRKRVAGWTAPLDAEGRKPVYVGRPSRWSNPFAIERHGKVLRVVDLGDRSRVLREEPQEFAAQDASLARLFVTRMFALHTGPIGLYAYDDATLAELRTELAGRDLSCWCPEPEPGETDWCHGAVLLELANPAPARPLDPAAAAEEAPDDD